MGKDREYPEGIPGSRSGGPTGIPGATPPGGNEPPGSIYQPLDGSRKHAPASAPDGPPAGGPAWPSFAPGRYAASGAPAAEPARPEAPAPGERPQTLAEQVAAQRAAGRTTFVLAGWGRRLWAMILDGLLIGLGLLLITVPIGVGLGLTVNEAFLHFTYTGFGLENVRDTTTLDALLVAQVIAQPLLLAWLLFRGKGQTPGKRATGLRVVREDGGTVTLRDALVREFLLKSLVVGLLTVITFGVAFLVNYLYPLWDPQNRAGHDHFAKTRVVREGEPAPGQH